MNAKKRPLLILIAGSSGSGKTTVANEIIHRLSNKLNGVVICQDRYYKDNLRSINSVDKINFDHPSAFDWDLLKSDIKKLLNNESIQLPIYNYVSHVRENDYLLIQPANLIILEGIHAFYDKELLELSDLAVFVETSKDESFIRRLERDLKDRGRSIESIIHQWRTTVQPMYSAFIEPLKIKADIIIPWNESQRKAVEIIRRGIKDLLKDDELLPTK